MRKILVALMLCMVSISFTGCDLFNSFSGCGTIYDHSCKMDNNGNMWYYVHITDDSGKSHRVSVSEYYWYHSYEGEYACFE